MCACACARARARVCVYMIVPSYCHNAGIAEVYRFAKRIYATLKSKHPTTCKKFHISSILHFVQCGWSCMVESHLLYAPFAVIQCSVDGHVYIYIYNVMYVRAPFAVLHLLHVYTFSVVIAHV